MLRDSAAAVWWTIVLSFCVLLFAGAVFAFNAGLYPAWLGIQRNAVEQSKSYVDSANGSLTTYAQEYRALDTKIAEAGDNSSTVGAYKAQQKAILNSMCQQIDSMRTNTVAPAALSFMTQHGGC